MGVDYTAMFGIGFQIKPPIDENDKTTYRSTLDGEIDNMYDFGKYVCDSSKYRIEEVGDTYEPNPNIKFYIFKSIHLISDMICRKMSTS